MIRFQVAHKNDVAGALKALVARMRKPAPLLESIGKRLVESTKQRFTTHIAPSGAAWPSRADGTSTGLLVRSGRLRDSIRHVVGADAVAVGHGTETFYGAFHQVGTYRNTGGSTFVRSKRLGKNFRVPTRARMLPPRPFLGISAQDSHELGVTGNLYINWFATGNAAGRPEWARENWSGIERLSQTGERDLMHIPSDFGGLLNRVFHGA